MTPDETFKKLRELLPQATQVVSWYAHSGGDCYGPSATVRGPFFRWFTVREVASQYKQHVADDYIDAKFAAECMNSAKSLLDTIDRLTKQNEIMKEALQSICSPIPCPACSMDNPPPEVPCYCADFNSPIEVAKQALKYCEEF